MSSIETLGLAIPEGGVAPGIVGLDRPALALLAGIVRDPLNALPSASFRERMVLTRDLGRLRAYVSDPALIYEAFVRNADRLAKSAEMKRVLGSALGDGLLTSDGAVWRHQRQALAPPFQPDRVAALLPAMIAAAEATRDRWLALPPGTMLDVGHEMMHTTFAIILETMLSGRTGIDAARVERGVGDFLGATSWMLAMAILRAPRWMPFPGRARAQAATRFMRRIVRERVAARRAAGVGPDDLIGMLLAAADPDSGRPMKDGEVVDNILTFIGAGHETTALALSWTFALLAAHPEVRARVIAEIAAVTGAGPVQPSHIERLVYTRQVVSETMRLYPPAPIIARTAERAVDVGGVRLPAGTVLLVPIYAVHRHARLWPRPETFDPERFAPDAIRARHRFAYMPFGAGPRVCIGATFAMMEAVAILAVLAKALWLEATEPLPPAQMRITLRPARPLRMRIVPITR